MHTLDTVVPRWWTGVTHEPSASGPASRSIARRCPNYSTSYFMIDVEPGVVRDGRRCEDLRDLTFPSDSFDLVITQDVLEHVLDSERVFAEIARVLRPGGLHVFTVPCWLDRPTTIRAHDEDGRVVHDAEPMFHQGPVDPEGTLVVTDWGFELPEVIWRASGMSTIVYDWNDRRLGLLGPLKHVFVSRKATL